MAKISSGIPDLDALTDSLFIGDNVVWEVESGTAYKTFLRQFIRQSFAEQQKVIYVSFNRSPQSIVGDLSDLLSNEHFVLIDCFTAGKGKNDNTFLRFYETGRDFQVIRIEQPRQIDEFTRRLNHLEDSLPVGARYIFDSLTGMQDLWGEENLTYRFFTYMCPRLYDLGTVAYWILEKDAHSQTFKANLRHITQVVIDLSKKKEKIFFKALKLDGRSDREAFKQHQYEIDKDTVRFVAAARKAPLFDIGSRIRESRTRLGLSQKELADRIGLTPSFVSQIENNQISPSLNSFLQVAEALGIKPSSLLQAQKKFDDVSWLIRETAVRENLIERDRGCSLFGIIADNRMTAYLAEIGRSTEYHGHFVRQKKDQLVHLLSGKVSVTIDRVEKNLKPGDTVYLKDSLPSGWKNTSAENAQLLVVCV